MSRRVASTLSLTLLAALLLASAVQVLRHSLLQTDMAAELDTLVARHPAMRTSLVLLYPGEELLAQVSHFDLLREHMVLLSQHTHLFPLYRLRGWPSVFLVRKRGFDWKQSNFARWPHTHLDDSASFDLFELRLAARPFEALFDQLAVARVEGATVTPSVRSAGAYAYAEPKWDRLELQLARVDKVEYRCLALHPEPGFTVRIAAPLGGNFALAQLHYAMRESGDLKKESRYTLTAAVNDASGKRLQQATATTAGDQLGRWHTLEVGARAGQTLTIEVAVNQPGRHHLCLMGDLLP